MIILFTTAMLQIVVMWSVRGRTKDHRVAELIIKEDKTLLLQSRMDPNRSADTGFEDLTEKSRPDPSPELTSDKLWLGFPICGAADDGVPLAVPADPIPIQIVADEGIPLAAPADPPVEDGEGTQSLKKRYARNKMDPTSTCVDSALEILARCDEHHWTPIRVGLDFCRTFLTVIPQWSVADEGVRQRLRDLPRRIEDAFEKTGWEIEDAIEKEDVKHLDALRSSVLEKIDHFKTGIREAYDFLSKYAFQTAHPPLIPGSRVWFRLYGSLLSNSQNLLSVSCLSAPLYNQFEHILKFLQGIRLRDVIFRYPEPFRDLCTQHGGVGICFARLLFSCWLDEKMVAENITVVLSDTLQKIKPTTPRLMGMYLKAIKSQRYSHQKALVEELVGITLLSEESLEPLPDELVFLIRYLVELPDKHAEDEEIRRSNIERLVCDAASLTYSSKRACGNDEPALLPLFQKVELVKIEILLIQLGESDSNSKTRFESIHKGVRFHDAYSEKLMLILQQIEALTSRSECRSDSSEERKIQEGRFCDVPYVKLSLDFYLTAIQAFLMELMRCRPSLIVLVKDQIHTLSEGSKLFYKYSSILPLKNADDMEQIFTFMDGAVGNAETLHNFYHSSPITEHTIREMSVLLSKFLGKFDLLNAKMKDTYLQFQDLSMNALPKTLPGLGFVDFFLERLSELLKNKTNSIAYSINNQIEAVLTELNSLRSLLKKVGEKRNETPEVKDLHRRVTWAAYHADYIIDSILLLNGDGCHMLCLSDVIAEVKFIKIELMMNIELNNDFTKVQKAVQASGLKTTYSIDTLDVGEIMVSLDDEEKKIIGQLTRRSSRREVLTIVGMPGIGKTTFAKKVYEHLVFRKHFQSAAWCCISQEYRRREVVLKILSDIGKTTDETHEKSDSTLVEIMRQSLMGKRYLVVMDDVWGTEAWTDLGIAFPDESYGSWILFTSRFTDVASQLGSVHPLRFLNVDESWKLLQKRVFHNDKCPKELMGVGRVIAESCKGLPLAVVAVAGLLKRTGIEADRWEKIKEDLNSRILEDPENQCKHILELSYNDLPHDLRPCFLYFAAFGEDDEIPVKRLIRLWIAEGFVRKVNQKASLEDIAEGYVMDLIGRSLLMAAKRRSNGRVKACKVHDMLHKLCSTKVQDENFLESISGYEKLFPSSTRSIDYGVDLICPSKSEAYEKYRLSICSKRKHFVMLKPSGLPVRTLLFSATSDTNPRCHYDMSFVPQNFKLLRVLDIESINMGSFFPKGIESLDPLRYLAISGDLNSVPSTIVKLWNLETFIVKGLTANIKLPSTIWSMSRLRHLHVNNGAIFDLQDENHNSSSRLDNLVTLSTPAFSKGDDAEEIMKKFPELKKLRCTFSPTQHSGSSKHFLALNSLKMLESLKILYYGSGSHFCEFSFPSKLKKLSLSGFSLTWDCISAIGALSGLEVLTLVSISFDSSMWEMRDGEFSDLKILKLDSLDIVQWNASSDHLPSLQRLVVRSCKQLQQIPASFGEIYELQMIELMWCSTSTESSLETIRKQQVELLQNTEFRTIINDPDPSFRSF